MKLYHGSMYIPKIKNQKELGIHVSPDPAEARLHYRGMITMCDADIRGAIECEDFNDWVSLEAFIGILECISIRDARNIAVNIWISADLQANTKEASAVMRDYLLDLGVDCIYYIDAYDIPGTPCYILLKQEKFTPASLEEGYSNLVQANQLLAGQSRIFLAADCKVYYSTGQVSSNRLPNPLVSQSPEDVAEWIKKSVRMLASEGASAEEVLERICSWIKEDYGYDVNCLYSSGRVCIHSDSLLDNRNPLISVNPSKKQIKYDVRKNAISIPVTRDIEHTYHNKVKPFIEQSMR